MSGPGQSWSPKIWCPKSLEDREELEPGNLEPVKSGARSVWSPNVSFGTPMKTDSVCPWDRSVVSSRYYGIIFATKSLIMLSVP